MSQQTAEPASFLEVAIAVTDAVAKLATIPKVYPAYIASRIKSALRQDDPRAPRPHEHIIESVGEIETIGDCKYALVITAHNGTRHRVTVEVLK